MLKSIAVNIISNFLFLLILITIGWLLYVLTRRSRLLRFYGINVSRRMVVYLSNLRIMLGGAIGVDDRLRAYQGSAVAFGEMLAANQFRDLFNYLLPSLSDKPGVLSKLLISDVQLQLLASPLEQRQLEHSSSFISLGSPAYNVASGFIETALHSRTQFQLGGGGAMLVGDVPPITDTTYGFVERIVDEKRRRCVFYVAGLSELATAGAVHFLATEWARLYRKYGNNTSFVVMLRFEPTDFRRWSIVFER